MEMSCGQRTCIALGKSPLLYIPAVKGHPADPVAVYQSWWQPHTPPHPTSHFSPSLKAAHILHMYGDSFMIAKAFKVMFQAPGVDQTLYSLHSLWR